MPRRIADPAVMRAVAHPLRLAILTEMWDADRPLRATDLAEILGEPANSVSYHIRRLRDAGYVLDAEGPEGATARDHWYVSPQRGITGDDATTDADGLHEALGAGGMIRVPNPHAPAVLSRFDEEINRRARAECTTADVIIERALIHYLRSA